jgi:hypothetical protein
MKEGSLVEWNGNPLFASNGGQVPEAALLKKGEIYTIDSLTRHINGAPGAFLIEKGGIYSYELSLLREIQPPDTVDIAELLRQPIHEMV